MSSRLKLMITCVAGLTLLAVMALPALAQFGSATITIGLVAYALGLRHAFDADHIAAIDNVTRRLRQAGQRPVAVGFFFSLGHSTVVMALILGLALAFRNVHAEIQRLTEWGALVSDIGSAIVLTLIGLANFAVFRRLLRTGSAKREVAQSLENAPSAQSRIAQLWSTVNTSWKMYPVGMLFGLGFDTATEVALLAISVGALQSGQFPLWVVMLFPLLFAAGMCLMDTVQSLLMLRMYDWAIIDGNSSLKLNTLVTGLSVIMALGVACVKWASLTGLLVQSGRISDLAGSSELGLAASGVMAALWLAAYLYRRWTRPSAMQL